MLREKQGHSGRDWGITPTGEGQGSPKLRQEPDGSEGTAKNYENNAWLSKTKPRRGTLD